jgi:hypothetical protein
LGGKAPILKAPRAPSLKRQKLEAWILRLSFLFGNRGVWRFCLVDAEQDFSLAPYDRI